MRRVRLGRLTAAALAFGIGSAGCASAPLTRPAVPAAPLRDASLEEVRAAYDAYCREIQSVSASGDLDVRDLRTGKTQKLGVRLIAARDGKLYLKGSVAIVTAVEVSSNGDRFWFMVPSKKTVWTGSAGAPPSEEREDAPYYALRPADVAWAFLPAPLEPAPDQSLAFEADRRGFSVTVVPSLGGAVRRRVTLDRASLQPARIQSFDEDGELVSSVSLGRFEDGLPRQLVIERPVEGYVASFSLDKASRNAAAPERAFEGRTPDGYKVVEVQ